MLHILKLCNLNKQTTQSSCLICTNRNRETNILCFPSSAMIKGKQETTAASISKTFLGYEIIKFYPFEGGGGGGRGTTATMLEH